MWFKTKTIQSTSECSSERKVKVTFHAEFNELSSKLLESWVTKRWKGEFQGSPERRGKLLSREMGNFHVEVHSNRLTWRIGKIALNIQLYNYVGIQVRCGIGKSECACVLSVESHCLHFYPEKPLVWRWPKSHLFLTEVTFSVEILQFWAKIVAQAISGSKLVLHVPCCSPALGVSGILAFSRSSSFFCSRYSFFRRKSTQNLLQYYPEFFLPNELLSLGLVSASEELQEFKVFSPKT